MFDIFLDLCMGGHGAVLVSVVLGNGKNRMRNQMDRDLDDKPILERDNKTFLMLHEA
jgi:hypothetical protein